MSSTNMTVNAYASYGKLPTATEPGILGIKVVAASPISRPIHIALVLDTSGSMEGDRIDSVKNTLNVLVDRLNIGDKITIVGFSSSATTVVSNLTISDTNRASTKAAVDLLTASGGTNMESGIAELGKIFTNRSELPDSLVLMTDGCVNEGITSVSGMYSLLSSYVPTIPVYALGYGDDHASDFMKGLSERTNGTYTFIDNEIALPASIGDLLGGLQSEVAKVGSLTYPASWTCLELNAVVGQTSLGIGSLIADKPTWALFSVPAGTVGGDLSLSFKLVNASNSTVVGVTIDGSLDRLDVIEQELRCVAAKALDVASTHIKNNNVSGAQRIIVDAIAAIGASEAVARPLAIRMKAQLDEMSEEITKILTTPPRIRRMGGAQNFNNLLLRTSSVSTQYRQQRGANSNGGADLFSSPIMAERQSQLVSQYSADVHDPAEEDMT